MKVVLTTTRFTPSIGGVETVVDLLARGLTDLGHEIRVVTLEPNKAPDAFPYEVVRRPGWLELWREYRRCDAYVMHGPSNQLGWPALTRRRPAFLVHHIRGLPPTYERTLPKLIRRELFRVCRHLAVSESIARELRLHRFDVVPNPYDDECFRLLPNVGPRDSELIFVGRLFDFKGVFDLIDAMLLLRERGLRPSLLMVGEGLEEENLRWRITESNLTGQVRFMSGRDKAEIARQLNRHRILVFPSRSPESFGLVALEGIACGCAVVGGANGGTPVAIGPCGVTFRNGDVRDLADRIEHLLLDHDAVERCQAGRISHLERYRPTNVARAYLSVFERAGVRTTPSRAEV